MRRVVMLGAAVVACAIAGCDAYPPAENVVRCAARRLATEQGAFSVEQHPGSWLTSTEYVIVYQKPGSTDRAVIIYNRRDGPVTVETHIAYGNHAEIAEAVRAIELCAQPR